MEALYGGTAFLGDSPAHGYASHAARGDPAFLQTDVVVVGAGPTGLALTAQVRANGRVGAGGRPGRRVHRRSPAGFC